MSSPLDSNCKLALVLCTRSRYSLGNHFSLLCDEAVQSLFVLVVDVDFVALAKLALTLLPQRARLLRWHSSHLRPLALVHCGSREQTLLL
jgi:hypothetical protein